MAMRFRAHDTFFIRKGWLSKGMERIVAKPDLFVDKNENPMDILGIGTNMVKALRYWLQVVGLTEEPTTGRRVQTLTEFGQVVYDNDRYIEELGTLYLLQYQLAKRKTDATQCHLDKDCFIVRNSYTADKHFVYLLYFYLITLLT